ncbi:MAG: GNAT family N-acetyltransferase [Methylobacteriaceae bacterium]|nr:GNAT family N-acetyltransferase [Methylobacteriaceae bacterium]
MAIVDGTEPAFLVRPARTDDVPAMQEIELDAARSYGSLAETRFCLDLPARSAAEHAAARERGITLVGALGGRPAAFLLAMPLDGHAHILELAVAQAVQGRGHGRQLIAAFEAWASAAGFTLATLTTFRDVPWNAPFYARLGYQPFDVTDANPELAEVVREEREAGVHQAPRVAMRKRLRG